MKPFTKGLGGVPPDGGKWFPDWLKRKDDLQPPPERKPGRYHASKSRPQFPSSSPISLLSSWLVLLQRVRFPKTFRPHASLTADGLSEAHRQGGTKWSRVQPLAPGGGHPKARQDNQGGKSYEKRNRVFEERAGEGKEHRMIRQPIDDPLRCSPQLSGRAIRFLPALLLKLPHRGPVHSRQGPGRKRHVAFFLARHGRLLRHSCRLCLRPLSP